MGIGYMAEEHERAIGADWAEGAEGAMGSEGAMGAEGAMGLRKLWAHGGYGV